MKKALTVAILFVMLMTIAMTAVSAATASTLADELYAIGSKYGMSAGLKTKMERYLAENKLSDEDCDKIVALAKEAAKIMDDNNTTDPTTLSAELKAELKALAVKAADIAGVTLDFKKDRVDVYKDGELLTAVPYKNEAAYTGSNSVVFASSLVAVVILAAVVAKKRLVA